VSTPLSSSLVPPSTPILLPSRFFPRDDVLTGSCACEPEVCLPKGFSLVAEKEGNLARPLPVLFLAAEGPKPSPSVESGRILGLLPFIEPEKLYGEVDAGWGAQAVEVSELDCDDNVLDRGRM
jgi:hypothetical protein